MATLSNYARKCPTCNGKWLLYTIKGKVTGSLFGIIGLKEPDTHIVCSDCKYGVQFPKQVIYLTGRFEPQITY